MRLLRVLALGLAFACADRGYFPSGNYDGQFVWPHCVAIGNDGAVYVGDVKTGMRVQKFVKK